MGQKPLATQPGSRLCGRRGPRPARVTTSRRRPLPAALPAGPGGRQVACRATRLQRAGVAEGTKGFRGEGAPGPSRAGMQGGAGEHGARWKQVSDVGGGGSGGRVHVGVTAAARSLTAPPLRSPGQPSRRSALGGASSPLDPSGHSVLHSLLETLPFWGSCSSGQSISITLATPPPWPIPRCRCLALSPATLPPPRPVHVTRAHPLLRVRAHTHTLRHTLLGSRPEPARCSVLAWASPVPACADLSICMTPSPGDRVPAAAGRSAGSPAAPAGAWQGLRRHPERAHWFVGAGSPGRPPLGPSTDLQVQSRV